MMHSGVEASFSLNQYQIEDKLKYRPRIDFRCLKHRNSCQNKP